MEGYSIWVAVILAVWAYIAIVTMLGPGFWWHEPLISGLVTGLVVGDVGLGLQIGASLTLMSLGMHTYGGATIPDFMTGAILGTAFGALGGAGPEAGLAIAIPAALLMTQLDILGRAVTTVFIHGADAYLERGDVRGVTKMHLWGHLPWGLSRAIPVFLAVWLGSGPVQAFMKWLPQWFMNGMKVTGAILPALGFALLLAQLPVRRYWPFMVLGFVLFAYLKMPIIGIALLAVALAALYGSLKGGEQHG